MAISKEAKAIRYKLIENRVRRLDETIAGSLAETEFDEDGKLLVETKALHVAYAALADIRRILKGEKTQTHVEGLGAEESL